MTNALAAAVQSMQNDLQYLTTISHNMVNMATPGYKRSIPVTQAFSDAMHAAGASASAPKSEAIANGIPTAFLGLTPTLSGALDISAGPVKQTGRPWDLAIVGDGYFEVETPDGPAYTRAGDFHLDGSGRLVSSGGFPVQGYGGDIRLNGGSATIDSSGRVIQDGVSVGQIKVVQIKDGKGLIKTSVGLLRPSASGMVGSPDSQAGLSVELQVGYLESSNVTPLREMISMMETTRHFEAAQKLFQGYDETLRSAIQKLGEF